MVDGVRRVSVSVFFLALLLIGIGLYRDYGISWDEPQQRLIGAVSIKYCVERFAPSLITEKAKAIPELNEFEDKDYGVAFEAPAFALEQLLKLQDHRDIFQFRHLLTFLMFPVGAFAIYRLASRRFSDWRIGLLASMFLVLTPRFFGEAFYNSKDMVFMEIFAVAMNTMVAFCLRPSIKSAFLNALATAFAVNVRIMGIAILFGTITFSIIRIFKKEVQLKRQCVLLLTYTATSVVLITAMWPWLWSNPFWNFLQAFKNMSQFRWDSQVFYMGSFIRAINIPWHYSLVWIAITTPPLYLCLFLIGFISTIRLIIANRWYLYSNINEFQDIVFLSVFLGPIFAVVLLHSVLYGGWRQLYFIYPAFLLVVIKGFVFLWDACRDKKIMRTVITFATVACSIASVFWMCKAHPFQNVYFNSLAGNNVRSMWEMDYWGLGNRQAFEYILEHDKSKSINIWHGSSTPIISGLLSLTNEGRQRFNYADNKCCPYYVVTNYRLVNVVDDSMYERDYDLFYQLKVDGLVILSVYKLKDCLSP